MTTAHPFELHAHSGGGFVSFDRRSAETMALPLLALNKALYRERGTRAEIVLEFDANQVILSGAGLSSLLEHLLAGRVKTIREGSFEGCVVDGIQIVDC